MNDLLNMNAISALDLSAIKNAALVKESESLAALQSKIMTGAAKLAGNIEAIRREQAVILHRIQTTKLYEKDGFKSLAEYAETIGLNKSNAHQLAATGNIYSDNNAPEQLTSLSPSKLAALIAAINTNKEQVYKDAAAGALDGMTQAQLKDYAAATKTTKAKVVKTYTAWYTAINGERVQEHFESDGRTDGTIDEWKKEAESAKYEVVTIPADKDGNKRLLGIDDDGSSIVFTLIEYKPNSNGKVKATSGKAEFLARAAAEGMSEEQIATVCRVMGW